MGLQRVRHDYTTEYVHSKPKFKIHGLKKKRLGALIPVINHWKREKLVKDNCSFCKQKRHLKNNCLC